MILEIRINSPVYDECRPVKICKIRREKKSRPRLLFPYKNFIRCKNKKIIKNMKKISMDLKLIFKSKF